MCFNVNLYYSFVLQVVGLYTEQAQVRECFLAHILTSCMYLLIFVSKVIQVSVSHANMFLQVFRSIPYARPPTGQLRWKDPL